MEGGKDFAVFGYHLGCELIVRMLQLLKGRNLGEDTYQKQGCEQYCEGC